MRFWRCSLLGFALSGCVAPSHYFPNQDFSPPGEMELVRAFELRDRYELPKPSGSATVYIDSVAVHHVYSEASTIAWRDPEGRWHRSQVAEDGPGGLLDIERRLDSNSETIFSSDDAEQLDRLISDFGLYSGAVKRTGETGIGAPYHVMSIVSQWGRVTVRWDGRLRGKTGRMADIILGHD